MKRKNLFKNGYTLIEIVISLFIIGVVLLIYATASNSVILNRSAKNQQLAHRIAVSLVEDLKAAPLASLPGSGPLTHPLLSSLPNGQALLQINDYNGLDGIKKLVVRVSWQEPGAKTHETSIGTLKTNKGL